MDLSSVETFFRRTLLVGGCMAVVAAGMLSLKIIKAPKHRSLAQTTPAPTPAGLDVTHRESERAIEENVPVTGLVSFHKRAQP